MDFVEEALGEERTKRTVAKAGSENFFLARTAFSGLEVTAGKTAGCGEFFAVVDGQGKKVLTRAKGGGCGCGDEQAGLPFGYGYCAACQTGQCAGGYLNAELLGSYALCF